VKGRSQVWQRALCPQQNIFNFRGNEFQTIFFLPPHSLIISVPIETRVPTGTPLDFECERDYVVSYPLGKLYSSAQHIDTFEDQRHS